MGLIDVDKIQDEIKKCDGVASDDYGKGIREGIRRALLRISETETVNTEEIRADERTEVIEELKSLLQIEYQKDNIDWSEMCVLNKVIKQLKEKR